MKIKASEEPKDRVIQVDAAEVAGEMLHHHSHERKGWWRLRLSPVPSRSKSTVLKHRVTGAEKW